MDLKCRINNKDFKLIQGTTFSEEYNETLDSATLMFVSNEQEDIRPLDDIFIYDKEFNGYNNLVETETLEKSISSFQNDIIIDNQVGKATYIDDLISNEKFEIKKIHLKANYYTGSIPENLNIISKKRDSNFETTSNSFHLEIFNYSDFATCQGKDNYIYIFGGYDSNGDFNNQIFRYNITTKEIEALSTIPTNIDNFDYYKRVGKNTKVAYDYLKNEFYFSISANVSRNIVLKLSSTNLELVANIGKLVNIGEKITSLCYSEQTKCVYVFVGSTLAATNDNIISIISYNTQNGIAKRLEFGGKSSDWPNSYNVLASFCLYDGENTFLFFISEDVDIIGEPYAWKVLLDDEGNISANEGAVSFQKISKEDGGLPSNISFYSCFSNAYSNCIILDDYKSTQKRYLIFIFKYSDDITLSIQSESIPNSIIEPLQKNAYFYGMDFNTSYILSIDRFNLKTLAIRKNTKITDSVVSIKEKDVEVSFNDDKTILKLDFFDDEENNQTILTFNLENGYYINKQIFSDYFKDFEYTINFTFENDPMNPSDKSVNTFYKHLLVDSVSEEILNLKKGIFKYTITAFSETKGLEYISLPNRSITQPLNGAKKKNVYEYAEEYLKLYSPKIKVSNDSSTWQLVQKYTLDPSLKDFFTNSIAPDFSLNNPNLREFLSKLFIVKDRIPYVKDDVIYALDITERKSDFDLEKGQINFVSYTLSSQNYCNNLRKTYSDGLSQQGSGRYTEYLGFRNVNNALMTVGNMRIETRFPIYKINKVYLCYYKKIGVYVADEVAQTKIFLCKQDITKLVKLNSERNLLSEDWDDFYGLSDPTQAPNDIDELAKYKIATVGYDIGSTTIEGWGTKLTYPIGIWWNGTKTYIQNIVEFMDEKYPYGIYDFDYITEEVRKEGKITSNFIVGNLMGDVFDNIVSPQSGVDNNEIYDNDVVKMKCFFFEIEYEPFYNGAIVHSKNFGDKDITIADNPSSSLSLLESDGLFATEKLNRYGNKNVVIPARYTNFEDLQNLGQVFNYNKLTDVVIYHREFSIFDNVINCTYYGSKDYVLKNYFTTVYAKHRTYNLMSYGESITRSENKKMFLLLSKKTSYYENPIDDGIVFDFKNETFLSKLFSFFNENGKAITIDNFEDNDKINYGYFKFNDNCYVSDTNAFVSGYSLCLNIAMYDNIMVGTYIKKIIPYQGQSVWEQIWNLISQQDVKDDYTGSVQSWYKMIDDSETGQTKNLGFYFGHIDKQNFFLDKVVDNDKQLIENVYYNHLFKLPYISNEVIDSDVSNKIGFEMEVNKDNKEKIDMTVQFEPITDDDNILFSQWMMKLSNLITTYHKTFSTYSVSNTLNSQFSMQFITSAINIPSVATYYTRNKLVSFIKFEDEKNFNEVKNGNDLIVANGAKFEWPVYQETIWSKMDNVVISLTIAPSYVKEITDDYIILICDEYIVVNYSFSGGTITEFEENQEIRFDRITNIHDVTGGLAVDVPLSGVVFYKGWTQIDYVDTNGKNRSIDNIICKSTGGFLKTDDIDEYNNVLIDKAVLFSSDENLTKKTYYQNLFITFTNEVLKKTTIYDEILEDNFNYEDYQNFIFFNLIENNNEPSKLRILAKKSEISTQGSIRFYFLDNDGDKKYHFVFGVNITEEDYNNVILDGDIEYCVIDIYISSLYTKDSNVYDINHNLIGKIENYVDSPKKYGQNQYFYGIIDNEKEDS